jgi:hypothetical protein
MKMETQQKIIYFHFIITVSINMYASLQECMLTLPC